MSNDESSEFENLWQLPDAVYEGGVWVSECNSDIEYFITRDLKNTQDGGAMFRVEFYLLENAREP